MAGDGVEYGRGRGVKYRNGLVRNISAPAHSRVLGRSDGGDAYRLGALGSLRDLELDALILIE